MGMNPLPGPNPTAIHDTTPMEPATDNARQLRGTRARAPRSPGRDSVKSRSLPAPAPSALRHLSFVIRHSSFALLLATLVAPLAAAQPEIINRADLSYFHTPSGLTNHIISAPVRAVVQALPPPVLRYYTDSNFTAVALAAALGSPLFPQAEAPACNTSPATIQTNVIILTTALSGDRETFTAVETAPNSGIFRILPNVPTRDMNIFAVTQGNGFIETTKNDIITAEIDGCGTSRAVTTILIDPGGVVFDSRSNLPIAGARVTLLDATTGLPATVFDFDGLTPAPNTVTTGADGRYLFPTVAPGTYRLQVLPPPGYTGPSTVSLSALPSGRLIANPGSFGGNFAVNAATGPVEIDYPLDAVTAPGAGLFVQKTPSRATAEIGDFVDYTVRVKNVTSNAAPAVLITDHLPAGFAYQKGSARLDGAALPDPAGGAGPRLQFDVGALAPDATVTLTYRVRIGPGAQQGDGINRARAASAGPPALTSNEATARVRVDGGVFTDRGIIVGKVFVDANTNRIQDPGEPGVPGVRIFIEDGTYAITDSEGKYNLYGLTPRTHILKLDPITLPAGAKLEVLNTRFAGSPGTRFVELRRGELHRGDFALLPPPPEVMAEIEKRRATAERTERKSAELDRSLKTELTRDGQPLLTSDPKTLPASGTVGVTPGTAAARPVAPPAPAPAPRPIPRGPMETRTVLVPPGAPLPPQAPAAPPPAPAPYPVWNGVFEPWTPRWQWPEWRWPDWQWPAAAPNNYVLAPPWLIHPADPGLPRPPLALLPRVPAENTLTNLDNTLGFVDLRDGATLPMAQATVRLKGAKGATFRLLVNGDRVPDHRIGERLVIAERQLEIWEFIGVPFRRGSNALTVVQLDAFGNARGEKTITVIAPDKLARIHVGVPKGDVFADGKSPVTIRIRLTDENGVPITARVPVTIQSSLGELQAEDMDRREPGVQMFLEGGGAEFTLIPPAEPGEAQITASSGVIQGSAKLSFLPELRPFLAVGLLEGKVNISRLNLRALTPARSQDGFEEELRDFSINGNNDKATAAGRAAFYLKGKLKGEYLLTAAYDSEKETRERLFRDIQPDEFYPVYGDSSVKGFDAQSTGRLYVRVDKRKSYLLYGDFTTQSPTEARSLGNYSRSLTGVREHYEKDWISANLWASYDSTRQVIEELPGNGTSGPYFFRTGSGLVNSEKVEILTRDRNQPSLILKTEPLARFTDYEFEPFTGRLLFRRPIPSLDANLNPISIRVTYEVDQGGDKFWVYGADAQVKVHERVEVGGAAVRDENPQGDYGLYSANATVKLGPKTFLLGEYAHSRADAPGGGVNGNAERFEFRHQGDDFDARLYWARAGNDFSNNASVVSAGRIESGAKLSYRLAPNLRLVGQGIYSEDVRSNGDRKGGRLDLEYSFANQVRLELGGRYSVESATPAGPTTVGATPNEVKSLRARLSVPVPKLRGLSVYGELENDIAETSKRLIAAGGEYQLNGKTRLYARHEFIDALGGPFELNTVQQQNVTVFGLDTAYMKDGQLFNEYRARNGISGRESEAAIGLRNAWTVAEGVRVNTSFERVNPIEGGNQNQSTAVTGGLELTRNPDWKATARLEFRFADANDSVLNTLGYARRLNRDWTFLGRTILYLQESKSATGGDRTQARIQGGLAWRQTEDNRWNALGKYEFKTEQDDTLPGVELDRDVHILSLHANWQPAADWLVAMRYAGKVVFEDSNRRSDVYDAHLLSSHIVYDLSRRFDVGLNLSALFSGRDGGLQFGVGPEVGFLVKENFRLAAGYNFTGFRDQDLAAEEYTQHGFYIALRLKFDEALLGLRRGKEEKQ
jgi:uncharacterized repeat protein (TIGR01451 family)